MSTMTRADAWKNLKLCEEVEISGRFIYNGLRCFHEMRSFQHEEELFEVLYNLAVGLERLLKVAVVLIEHDADGDDQEAFERSLITHTHLELLARVGKNQDLRLAGVHNEFLALLGEFYKTMRYSRFSIQASKRDEKSALFAFLQKHLNIEMSGDMVTPTYNDARFKKFLGKTVGKIASQIYDIIFKEGAYTHELRYDSKASKIFLSKEYTFENEDVLWKELLLFFASSPESSGRMKALLSLTPLDFDPGLDADLLQCFGSEERKLEVMDELESLYEEIDKKGDRLQLLGAFDDPSADFESTDEEE